MWDHFSVIYLRPFDTDLELGFVDGEDVFRRCSVRVQINGWESVDYFWSSLDAADEGRDEDPVDRKPYLRSQPLTSSKRSNHTVVNERRVPRSSSCVEPEWVDLVNAVTVTHHQDVLVAIGGIGVSRRLHCCSDDCWSCDLWEYVASKSKHGVLCVFFSVRKMNLYFFIFVEWKPKGIYLSNYIF